MAKGAYIGVGGVAHKVKKGYVGVVTDVPIYETTIQTVNFGSTTEITDYFEVTNGTYYFAKGNSWYFNNNGGVNSSTASTMLTAKSDMEVSFRYDWSTEENWDKFTVKVAGTTIANAVSGIGSDSYSGNLTKGQTIEFSYAKDSSGNYNDDECSFGNITLKIPIQNQIGTETRPAARRIKRAYIGVGGVARPCWTGGEVAYYGTAPKPEYGKVSAAAATLKNQLALFGFGSSTGGGANDGWSDINVYNSELTRTSMQTLGLTYRRKNLAAAANNTYAIFAGGNNRQTSISSSDYVNAFDLSLTQTDPEALQLSRQKLTAASVGEYVLFLDGHSSGTSSSPTSRLDAYNESLTHYTNYSGGAGGESCACSTSKKDYALIAGGGQPTSPSAAVYAYDTSRTRSTLTNLSEGKDRLAATSVNNYVLFGGGSLDNSTQTATVDAYDASLTKHVLSPLSEPRTQLAATSISNSYALFAGGRSKNSSNGVDWHATVDVYDYSLTKSTTTNLSLGRDSLTGFSIGQYALFGGGSDNVVGNDKIIDVYTEIS